MRSITPKIAMACLPLRKTAGFTIVELIIALAITSVVGVAILMNYLSQSKAYNVQRELAHMQQNSRAAIYILMNDLRNIGRDPNRSGRYGIQSTLRDANGFDQLILTTLRDTDGDGIADEGAVQIIRYQIMDQNGDGRQELRRCDSLAATPNCASAADWQMIMDGVEDIGFAYAYDNGNEDLARFGGNANAPEIWAFDANNSNSLNANADSNGDGDIDVNDAVPAVLNAPVPLARIRAVRIWLLARSRYAFTDFRDTTFYHLGSRVLDLNDPANVNRQNFRHLLLTSVVGLQNFQLDPNI